MTAAVSGWSPVIMIGRMPAPLARATASRASARGGSIMPIRPSKDEILLDRLVERVPQRASFGERAEGDAERAQRLAGQLLVDGRISARRASVSGRASSPTSSCEQRASSTSGAPLVNTSSRSWRSASLCTVLISLRSEENGTSPTTREARVERLGLQPGLARRDDQRAFGRIALHRPASVPLLQDGVVGAVGGGERAHQLGPQRPVDRPAALAAAARPLARSRCRRRLTRPLAVATTRTVISFLVSVPVLSEAMTLAEPSVSTAARWRTMAFRFAMRCTPSESTAVTMAGKPSGTAATASATPRMSTSKMAEKPRTSSTRTMVAIITTAITTTTTPSSLPTRSSSFCSGVSSSGSVLQHAGDAPHFGLHARGGDDGPAAPVGGGGAAENHVVAVAEPGLSRDGSDLLRDRQALAGQGGFRGLQGGRLNEPRVRRNGVALLDEDDVARHELRGRDALTRAVPDHGRVRRRHLAQSRDRLLGAGLLNIAHHRVQQHDGEDRHRFVGQGGIALVTATAPRR